MGVGAIAMSASTIIAAANAQLLGRLTLRADEPASSFDPTSPFTAAL
jgi:hypothetical protein